MDDAFSIVMRTALVYGFLLLLVRVAGKNALAETNALHFVLALVIGDLVDDCIWGEVAVTQFIVGSVGLVSVHWLFSQLQRRLPGLAALLTHRPRRLIKDGVVDHKMLRHEHLTTENLSDGLRRCGVEHAAQVRVAHMEPDGHISVSKSRG